LFKTKSAVNLLTYLSLTYFGRLFGGLLADMRRRYGYYRSDIVDGLNLQCLATIVFLYFACITPIVTFGGVLGQMTDDRMVCVTTRPCETLLSEENHSSTTLK